MGRDEGTPQQPLCRLHLRELLLHRDDLLLFRIESCRQSLYPLLVCRIQALGVLITLNHSILQGLKVCVDGNDRLP